MPIQSHRHLFSHEFLSSFCQTELLIAFIILYLLNRLLILIRAEAIRNAAIARGLERGNMNFPARPRDQP
jgi:hypothetical protein